MNFKLLNVCEDDILELFSLASVLAADGTVKIPLLPDLPPDVRVVAVFPDPATRGLIFKLTSKEFGETPPGSALPEIAPQGFYHQIGRVELDEPLREDAGRLVLWRKAKP